MWRRWIPWRLIIRKIAQGQGFIDPIKVLSRLQRFAQPSEVLAPVELLRLSAVLHARGLMNSQAIQHNLDWVWPYWVVRQFNPRNPAFVPRAFSLTHINLTHRNWTAVGIPGSSQFPIIDPRGLVTPLYDGWSVDTWLISAERSDLIPSRLESVVQEYSFEESLAVKTKAAVDGSVLISKVDMIEENGCEFCRIQVSAKADGRAWIAVSLRPYNPEGVSQVSEIAHLRDGFGWKVDGKHDIFFSDKPDKHRFSNYRLGDVYERLPEPDRLEGISCEVEMATAAALFEVNAQGERDVTVLIPLQREAKIRPSFKAAGIAPLKWEKSLEVCARLELPDRHFQFLYEAALRTVILHTPEDIYPGPYTYKHFWFRDAAVILHAMLCAGLTKSARYLLDGFPSRQTVTGYFKSQEGEWDSNGQVLWIMLRYARLSGEPVPEPWHKPIVHAARWIQRKRLSEKLDAPHAGLFPAGFSAEHLGPNDYYYWDDFWGVAGLRSAAELVFSWNGKEVSEFRDEGDRFLRCIERSLEYVAKRLGHPAMPASPYRRMDTGAIGSLPADYPLALWKPANARIMATVEYLLENCFVEGGFFHDMSHSGINPYLTLHIAQILLRAGDKRYFQVMKDLAGLASPTGQWPEAVHPITKGGCMGDGQHVWAAAEWILMMRSLFVREEEDGLILFSGIPEEWLDNLSGRIFFGPVPTVYGVLNLEIRKEGEEYRIAWEAAWRGEAPKIEIRLPLGGPLYPARGQNVAWFSRKTAKVRP